MAYRLRRTLLGGVSSALLVCSTTSLSCSSYNSNEKERMRSRLRGAKPALDDIFQKHLETHHVPGLIYGVTLHGELVLSGSVGSITAVGEERGEAVPCKDKSMFRIASMSKSFTAMAIIQLRDKGLLQLTDPVSKYVPEVKHIAPLLADSPPLTVGHLLTMQGGFPQDDPWGDRLLDMSNEDFSKLLTSGLNLSNPTGVKYEYSNLGYAILGLVIKEITQMSYQEYITKHILRPLGMYNTVFEIDNAGSKLVQGYRWEDNQWKSEPLLHDGAFGAMGGMITTMNDFAKYMALHQNVWINPCPPDQANSILSPSSVREMHFPWNMGGIFLLKENIPPANGATVCFVNNYSNPLAGVWSEAYGYGLKCCQDLKGIRWVRHAGGLPGFSSEWRFLPDHGVGLAVFSNGTYCSMSDANHAAMSYLLQEDITSSSIQYDVDALSIRSIQLLNCLQNSLDDSIAEDIFATNFFLDKPKRIWLEDTAKIREMLKDTVSVSKVVPENRLRGHFVVTTKCGERVKLYFTMTPTNSPQIQTLKIQLL